MKPKTFESYEDAIAHLKDRFGEQRLGTISRKDIEEFLAAPHTARPRPKQRAAPAPLSTTTINYHMHILKFVLSDAVDQGQLHENPAVKVKPLPRPDREDSLHILYLDEIGRLLDVAEEPWRTFYLVSVHCGLRRGELCALKWRDLDLHKRVLHVRRSRIRIRTDGHQENGARYTVDEASLKSRHSRRTIDLSPSVVQALLALPAGDDPEQDYVFRSHADGPIDPDNVDRAWKRHLTAAGLADRPFHSTRHTHASLLIAAGVHPKAIQARLGHASITTTLNTYGHLMPSAFKGVGEKIDNLLSNRLTEAVEVVVSSS